MCPRSIRSLFHLALVVAAFCGTHSADAQRIQGSFQRGTTFPTQIILQETWGGTHRSIDSVAVDRKGRFAFPTRSRGPGFHRLMIGQEELVDLVIDPRESMIELRFSARPIQEYITVLRSAQNQRLWEYKRASREGQSRMAVLREERKRTSPLDAKANAALDQREAQVQAWQQGILDRLVAADPEGPFERIVLADKKLVEASQEGSAAIGAAMHWSDPALVRSSVYPKAIMAYLQNLPDPAVQDLVHACDSLLEWSVGDTLCWTFTRSFLLRLFSVYGPDVLAQELVDRYIVGSGSLHPPDAELLAVAAELMKVAVGAPAPPAYLVDPVQGDSTALGPLLQQQPYTVLFFYSSSCEHCHEQMPGLVDVHRDLREKGVQIIGVALDVDLDEFRTTLQERGLSWPSYSELNGWGSSVAKAFGVKSTPALYVLDASGTIVAKPYDHVELRTKLAELLP